MAIHLLITAIVLCATVNSVHSIGWTYPAGPIYKLVNESFSIICTLNLSLSDGANSSSLWFYNGKTPVAENRIQILNETSIQMNFVNAQPMRSIYTCKSDEHGVSLNDIYVGYPPLPVKNFKCRSYNWDYMICTFDKPDNPIPPIYSLRYKLMLNVKRHQEPFGASSNEMYFQEYECKLEPNYNGSYMTKIFDENYRQTHQFFKFTLDKSNALGRAIETFEIDHFSTIIPKEPKMIIADNITSNSVDISWMGPYKLFSMDLKHFDHELNITSNFDNGVWKVIRLNDLPTVNGSQHIKLDYANAVYTVRVRLRVEGAPDIDEMWSKCTNTTFRSASRLPDTAPTVDSGGFHINDYDDISLYWHALSPAKQNGNNSHYVFTEFYQNGERIKNVMPTVITDTMAKFELMKPFEYKFVLHSVNSMGMSKESSVLRVPEKDKRLNVPKDLKKIYENGQYVILWKKPDNHNEITSYTVFWCTSKSETHTECESTIDFKRLNTSMTSFTYPTAEICNFAVSANSETSSSGMVWALCTARNSNDIGKIKTLWVSKIQSTAMYVQWVLECVDSSIVEGYTITYCPTSGPLSLECAEPSRTFNATEKYYYITGLKPFTTYITVVAMFSSTRIGPESESLVNTTLEAAPTEPRNLWPGLVTNSSVTLFWKPPEELNGRIVFYEISYNNLSIKMSRNFDTKPEIEFKLNHLHSFTNYTITVRACTIACSPDSNAITIETRIGKPGTISQPNFEDNVLKFRAPDNRAGPIDYYELRKVMRQNGKDVMETVTMVSKNTCMLKIVCNSDADKYYYYVRAVNVLPFDERSHHVKRYTRSLIEQYVELERSDNSRGDNPNGDQNYLLKRHSNPEIERSSSGGANNFDRVRNGKAAPLSGQSAAVKNGNNLKGHVVSDSEGVVYDCERDGSGLSAKYSSYEKLEHLHGEWSIPSVQTCAPIPTFLNVYLIIFAVTAFVTLVVVIFKTTKKIKSMKNIVVELPAGLEDITKETKIGKNGEAGIDKVQKQPGDESIFDYEQEECLLPPQTSSLSSTASVENNSRCESTEPIDETEYDMSSNKYVDMNGSTNKTDELNIADVFNNKQKSAIAHQVPVIAAPMHQQNHAVATPSFPISNGYVQPSIFLQQQQQHHQQQQQQQPQQHLPISNGYVQHQAMARANHSGYTQRDMHGQPIMENHKTINENLPDVSHIKLNIKTPIVASTDVQGISGYVTHKQLSEFGHRMQ